MKLLLKLALRELFNAKRFSLLFIINLSLGILGFILIHSFKVSVNDTLASRSRILLGSDISLSARRSLNEIESKKVNQYFENKLEESTEYIQLYSMGQALNAKERSRLVLIKMIEKGFPLYGHLKVKPLGNVTNKNFQQINDSPKTWISPELAYQMKLKRGQRIKLGEQSFEVAGIITDDTSTPWRGIGLAPKLYISKKFQEATNLISFGSVARYVYLYKLQPQYKSTQALVRVQKDLNELIEDPAIRVKRPQNSSEQAGRVLNYLSDYLGLVALVAIFISGIGSSYLFQNFIFNKIIDIGIFKSLGLSLARIKTVFIMQLMFLGTCSILLALLLASILLPNANLLLGDLMQMEIGLAIGGESIAVSLFVGLLTIFVICYPLLKKFVHKKTIEMFHAQSSIDWSWGIKDIVHYIPLVLSLEILAVWQSHSLKVGSIFTLGVFVLVGLIGFILPMVMKKTSKVLVGKLWPLSKPFSISFGLALREILRSRLSTVLTFLSLSIGIMLLSLIGQLEVSLNKELLSKDQPRPSLFLFDIQMEQKDELIQFARQKNIPLLQPTPMVRSRLTKVNGKKYKRKVDEDDTSLQTREDQRRNRFRNRGINLTYALKTNYSQTIVEGEEFKRVYSGEGPVKISLEKRYAGRMGLEMGDQLHFEVLGVEFKGIVTSIRKIKWNSFLPNFFITLQPGLLEDAPQTYLAAVKEIPFEKQLEVQDQIVEKFPNISMINVTELIEKILSLFATMSVAIKAMAFLCILVGFFVIYAIIQNQMRKRSYDLALLKSLGSSSSLLMKQFLYEYLILSLLATIVGSFFSIVFGNIISQMFFDGVWSIDWLYLIVIVLSMSLLTILIVWFSTKKIYKMPAKSLLD